jgi:zinc protease
VNALYKDIKKLSSGFTGKKIIFAKKYFEMFDFARFTLKNGLKVILYSDVDTPLISVNILYKVGSKHEKESMTGFAHLFEHLMFGGSIHISNYDTPLEMAGGENNAFTNQDFTNYYLTIPAGNVETALWLESDRMLRLAFTPKSLEVQRKVVIEEFKERYLNKPYGDLLHLLYGLSYKVHPYKWPTIGKDVSHIEKATLEDVKQFFYHHYAPNNAIMTVAGNLDYVEMKKLVEKWFSDIPRRNIDNNPIPQEPVQREERRLTVKRDVPYSKVMIAYHMPGRTDKSFFVYDLISDILSNGKSARFFKNLMKKQDIFLKADAYVTGNIDNGLFIIDTMIKDGVNPEDAEKAIYAELNKIMEGNFEEKEMERMKNKYKASHTFGLYELSSKAFYFSYYELLGDASMIDVDPDFYAAVTKEQVVETSKTLFDKSNRNVLWYLKK